MNIRISVVCVLFTLAIGAGGLGQRRVSAITSVHGGAGADAARFFRDCVTRAEHGDVTLQEATEFVIKVRTESGERIEGLGHRIHTDDPRRDALWKLARRTGVAEKCVATSQIVEDAFANVRGMRLPINVDGVIRAVVADVGLDPRVAKGLFIFGRIAGLAAHHFEEVLTQAPMRRIDFARVEYSRE